MVAMETLSCCPNGGTGSCTPAAASPLGSRAGSFTQHQTQQMPLANPQMLGMLRREQRNDDDATYCFDQNHMW